MSGHARQTLSAQSPVVLASTPSLGVLRLVTAGLPVRPDAGERGEPRAGLLGGGCIHPIAVPITTIGRGLRNALVLLDPAVSREHVRLSSIAGVWEIENVSEHNAIWAGDTEVYPGQRTRVVPGEHIRLGATVLQLLAPQPRTATGLAYHDAAAPGLGDLATGMLGDIPVEDLGDDALAGGITALEAGGTRLLSPGVTLQFALKGQLRPTTRWVLGLGAALLFLLSALLTLGIAALVGQNALASGGPSQVLAAAAIPLVPVIGVMVVVGALDRYEREPWVMLLGAFLWGAVIAIPPVIFAERRVTLTLVALIGTHLGNVVGPALAQAFSAGLTEETIKGAGLVLLLWVLRDEFDNVTDGILYGVVIGAGFAMVENFVYFAATPRTDLGYLVVGRVVLGWLSHSTFTGFFGATLGYARELAPRRRRWVVPVLGFAAAILLHTYSDAVVFTTDALTSTGLAARSDVGLALVALLADYIPLFVTQAVLLRLALRALTREASIVREYLAVEVLDGVVTPDEYALLQNASLRATAEHRYALAYGLRAYVTARTLYQTATGLAFRKWHVAMGDPPKATLRQPEDEYRARIARLRRSLLRQIQRRRQGMPGYAIAQSAPPTQPLIQ